MNSRLPPRYLPTLTEVVYPKGQDANAEGHKREPTFDREPALTSAPAAKPLAVEPDSGSPPVALAPDLQALVQQITKRMQPQLEGELRSIAMQFFEAQFKACLPSLQLHMEAAVREALDQALAQTQNRKD